MTLIEILVVLVLIGIVLGIVGGNFIGKGEKAKADAAKIEIGQISQTLDLYKLEIGRYPTTQEGLQALISAPSGVTNWNGPYWKKIDASEGPVGQRVQVHFAGAERALRNQLARRRRQGRRRRAEQGHHELAMTKRLARRRSSARSAWRRRRARRDAHRTADCACRSWQSWRRWWSRRFAGGVSTSELKGATREIAAGLRLARSEALATRQETRVLLDLEQRDLPGRARCAHPCAAESDRV